MLQAISLISYLSKKKKKMMKLNFITLHKNMIIQ